ncbi:MAG TPA: M1 family aminopeptidase, partial [Candidatus Kryptonia bacterium]|nr:M1 family aminopeptidase [Candidatus Kryptonia bacterium]
ERGARQRVRWQSDRPIAGMSLVAGPYHRDTATINNQTVQLFVADDVAVDGDRMLRDAAGANSFFTARYGASGFERLTLFVTRRIRRAFNDGAGTMGLSVRYLRRGEYGFSTIAHEIAHNWWGATVSERWLSPGTGGEWIVEGLAEFSSLLAVEDRWGRDALTVGLTNEGFDPARQAAVSDMSVLDNGLAEAAARDTIYHKGAYVALMLRAVIGEEFMQQALRQFIERFRYTQATDRDLEGVITQISGQNVSQFFADWVRSAKSADLALEPSGADQVDVRNRGEAVVPSPIDLWVRPAGDAALEKRRARVGETVALPSGAELAVIDPQLTWADMIRFNNSAPRRAAPQSVAVSSRGDILVASGEPQSWAPVTITQRTADGKHVRSWEFERGLTQPPTWSPDGARILANVSESTGEWPTIVGLNAVDGSRTTIGYGTAPAFGGNGRIFAARGDQLVRFEPGRSRTIVRHRHANVESPAPSPSGRWVAYAVTRGNAFDLRVCDEDGGHDRSLLAWDRDRFVARWAPDESRLYVVLGGNWDWQIWEVPLDGSAVRVLVREAADIRDLALNRAGDQLAFSAAPALGPPPLAHELFVLDLKSGRARVIGTANQKPSYDIRQLAWETPDSVLAIAAGNEPPLLIPQQRALRRFHLNDGSSEEVGTNQ